MKCTTSSNVKGLITWPKLLGDTLKMAFVLVQFVVVWTLTSLKTAYHKFHCTRDVHLYFSEKTVRVVHDDI